MPLLADAIITLAIFAAIDAAIITATPLLMLMLFTRHAAD